MTQPPTIDQIQKEALQFLEETFEDRHYGIYLDKGTSLFETLESTTAEEASLRASNQTSSLAAHTRHVVFYMAVLERVIRGEEVGKPNWREIWENDRPVTPGEWKVEIAALRGEYAKVQALLADPTTWKREDALGGFTSIAVHTAYHLGAIRQALAVIRSGAGHASRAHSIG